MRDRGRDEQQIGPLLTLPVVLLTLLGGVPVRVARAPRHPRRPVGRAEASPVVVVHRQPRVLPLLHLRPLPQHDQLSVLLERVLEGLPGDGVVLQPLQLPVVVALLEQPLPVQLLLVQPLPEVRPAGVVVHVVPPQRAVWVPRLVAHLLTMSVAVAAAVAAVSAAQPRRVAAQARATQPPGPEALAPQQVELLPSPRPLDRRGFLRDASSRQDFGPRRAWTSACEQSREVRQETKKASSPGKGRWGAGLQRRLSAPTFLLKFRIQSSSCTLKSLSAPGLLPTPTAAPRGLEEVHSRETMDNFRVKMVNLCSLLYDLSLLRRYPFYVWEEGRKSFEGIWVQWGVLGRHRSKPEGSQTRGSHCRSSCRQKWNGPTDPFPRRKGPRQSSFRAADAPPTLRTADPQAEGDRRRGLKRSQASSAGAAREGARTFTSLPRRR